MNFSQLKLYYYNIELVRPLQVKGTTLKSRKGYIIELRCGDAYGYGEIAPLEGFSPDTLKQAGEQIKLIRPYIIAEPVPQDVHKLDGGFDMWLGNLSLCPSVQFGIEMAVLNLLANVSDITLKELLAETIHTHIPINGLLQGNKDEILDHANELIDQGFHALKVKANGTIKDNIDLVQDLNKIIDGRALLHLDANQSWTFEEAIEFGQGVGLIALDYIEEPFKDIELIPEFFHQTMIPVALDESLLKRDFAEIKRIEGVDIIILKPSVIGGIEKTWTILREAKRVGLSTVISSVFESSVGLLTLANLAGCSFRNNAAGLDTAKWFSECLLKNPLEIHRGKIDIGKRMIQFDEIDFSLLDEVNLS